MAEETTDWTTDKALVFDVAYALSRNPVKSRTSRAVPLMDLCQPTAETIVQHLRLCGWTIEKKSTGFVRRGHYPGSCSLDKG